MHEYALHWDNFHDSLSSGFLNIYREQVGVDVTLVCEGGLLQAHKLVLTICSPYFRQIFQLNPHQHPIVVLKDVNQLVMQDLLSFIYKGEVNVKENHFEQFMKMAKMLQIKGLATSDDIENSTSDRKIPPKKPAAASTPASAKVNISLKPKLGAKRALDKDDAEPSTSKRPARSAAPKSFEDPLDDESIQSGTKADEPIQFEAIKCESVDLNVDPDATPFQFDYTEGEAGDDTGAGGMGFDDDNDNESDDDDDDFDATNDSTANTSNAKADTEKKKGPRSPPKPLLVIERSDIDLKAAGKTLAEHGLRFPLLNVNELNRVESLVNKSAVVRKALAVYFSKSIPNPVQVNGGTPNTPSAWGQSGLVHVWKDELWKQFNWRGTKQGKSMKDYVFFTHVLFEAWKDNNWTYEQYVEYIKKATHISHKRQYKKIYAINKRNANTAVKNPFMK